MRFRAFIYVLRARRWLICALVYRRRPDAVPVSSVHHLHPEGLPLLLLLLRQGLQQGLELRICAGLLPGKVLQEEGPGQLQGELHGALHQREGLFLQVSAVRMPAELGIWGLRLCSVVPRVTNIAINVITN